MKKIGVILMALAFVIGSINMISAGVVNTEQSTTAAKQIKVSGEVDMPMVSRDKGVNSVLDGVAGPAHQDSDNIWSPLITLNLNIDVGDKITSLIQLQNRRLDFGFGTGANVDFLGGDNIELAVKQAYLKLEKFLVQDLNFTYGLQNIKTTLREGEGAFFIDSGNSNCNYNNFLTEMYGARFKDFGEFGGFKFDYGSLKNSNYQVTIFFGKIFETATGVDQLHNDDLLNGAIVWFKPNINELLLNGSLVQMTNSRADINISTIGVGGDYTGAVPNMELYGEFYTQTGDYNKVIEQAASAMRFGGKYDIQHSLKPYVDVSYWMLSGGGTGTKNKNFLSFENVASTMILEDDVFGLDLDSNYTAVKVEGGISTMIDIDKDGSSEELKLKILIGSFNLSKVPGAAPNASKKLGTEIDLVATLQYNPSLAFTLGYATLSGADFFTDTTTYNAAESTMGMIIFGTTLKY